MIDVVSGHLSHERDWSEVWNDSEEREAMMRELERIKTDCLAGGTNEVADAVDASEYASSTRTQLWLVYVRANVQLWRNVAYVINKMLLHITSALILGFSFFKIGNSVG